MSFDQNSAHEYKLDRRFPKLVATNGKSSSPYRMRDGRLDDWSPFDERPVHDKPLPEQPAYENAVAGAGRQTTDSDVGWLAGFTTGLYRLRANWQHKREIARSLEHLRDLDDHLLRDIGLERWQVIGR